MPDLKEIKRVVIITEAALLDVITEEFNKIGVKGFNCTYCFGKGQHEYGVSDPYSSQSHIRIEVLANENLATAVFSYCNKAKTQSYPMTIFMDSVFVDKNDIKF